MKKPDEIAQFVSSTDPASLKKQQRVENEKRKLMSQARLLDVLLVKASMERQHITQWPIPDAVPKMTHETEIKKEAGGSMRVLFSYNCEFVVRDPNYETLGDKSTPQLRIASTFSALFFIRELHTLDDAAVESLAKTAGLLAIWPYWRDLIVVSCAKLGLPLIGIRCLAEQDVPLSYGNAEVVP